MLGLTPEQIAARNNGVLGWLGGSEAGDVMAGRWLALWEKKTGRVDPDDLSGVLAVQLGLHTEALNLTWFERETGLEVFARGEEYAHPYVPFMRCTLDGLTQANDDEIAVVQAKWTNPFSKIENIEQRYMAQVHHEMLVCGCRLAFLSVITGKPEYHLIEVQLDEAYAETLIQREEEFWSYVESDTLPPDVGAVAAPVRPSVYRTVDMTGNNDWAYHAGVWRENIGASRVCDKAAETLRKLVGADVGVASGHGVRIARAKNDRLLIKEDGNV